MTLRRVIALVAAAFVAVALVFVITTGPAGAAACGPLAEYDSGVDRWRDSDGQFCSQGSTTTTLPTCRPRPSTTLATTRRGLPCVPATSSTTIPGPSTTSTTKPGSTTTTRPADPGDPFDPPVAVRATPRFTG
jgi:hypothetical protein